MEPLSIILQLHTPDELILYSNIAHWIEGVLFLIVAGIALAQAGGYFRARGGLYLWPGLLIIAGIFLPVFAYSHHLGELPLALKATLYDPQQRQHMIMAALLLVAGVSEVLRVRGGERQTFLSFVFPAVLGVIGILFLTHPQHGTSEAVIRASLIHKYLGSVLVLSGMFRGAEIRWSNQKRLLYPWIVFLAIGALFLITYREPEGAYMIESAHQNMSQVSHNEVMP